MRRRKPEPIGLFSLACSECGAYLVRTESGFLSCPHGHGKLVRETEEEPQPDDGGMFAADFDGAPLGR